MGGNSTIIADLEKNGRERVRVSLDTYAGHDLIDIRVAVQLSEGTGLWAPTKKGISLRIAQLPALRVALAEAESQARAAGMFAGAA